MAVIRVNKTKDYTVMSNHHFKDKKLSLKAKGLLSQMLSLPDNWDYTIEGLSYINKDNVTAINTALKELRDNGYLVVTKLYPNQTHSGRIEYVYDIYEQPIDIQEVEKQGIEILPLEIQGIENQGQLNTKESSTKNKKLNIKDIIDEYTEDDDLKGALMDFAEMRKVIKKPLTERAWRIILGKLDDISADISVKIAVLNQSIEHNWQSVYPLKENGLKPQNKAQNDWAESWVQVTRCISLYGLSNGTKAMETMDQYTREAVKRMGWRNICMSQNPIADRSNYKFVYESVLKELGDQR